LKLTFGGPWYQPSTFAASFYNQISSVLAEAAKTDTIASNI